MLGFLLLVRKVPLLGIMFANRVRKLSFSFMPLRLLLWLVKLKSILLVMLRLYRLTFLLLRVFLRLWQVPQLFYESGIFMHW